MNLYIRNWNQWQTYRQDRATPPWIKVHRNLMTNPEWMQLSDAEKGQIVSIWIAAADRKGVIPEDPKMIRKVCALDEIPDVENFIRLGFLTTKKSSLGVSLASQRRQSDDEVAS